MKLYIVTFSSNLDVSQGETFIFLNDKNAQQKYRECAAEINFTDLPENFDEAFEHVNDNIDTMDSQLYFETHTPVDAKPITLQLVLGGTAAPLFENEELTFEEIEKQVSEGTKKLHDADKPLNVDNVMTSSLFMTGGNLVEADIPLIEKAIMDVLAQG